MTARVDARCANCGADLVGPYCHECGQSAVDHVASLRTFGAHVAEVVLQYDSRWLRTLGLLVARPGALTAEYLSGRRARSVAPLQVYAVSAALLFLAGTYHPLVTFDARARWFRSAVGGIVGFSNRLTEAEVAQLAARGVPIELFGERFVNHVTANLSTFLVASVPLFALATAAALLGRRRPFTHHVVFALHWSAFYLLVLSIGQLLPPDIWFGQPAAAIVLLATLVYLVVALRRTYGVGWTGAMLRALPLYVAYNAILIVWLEAIVSYARSHI